MAFPCTHPTFIYKGKSHTEAELRQRLKDMDVAMASKYISGLTPTPDAPFKKSWHELAFKKILKKAVDEGYDAVSWDTGETNAERYDLSKKVAKIESFSPREDGLRDVNIYRTDDDVWTSIGLEINKEGKIELVADKDFHSLIGKSLDDVIGKDLADKILSSNKDQSFAGSDLKVGGEGMKGFYDKMLPSFVNKYVKKWGGEVGTSRLEDPDLAPTEMKVIQPRFADLGTGRKRYWPLVEKSTGETIEWHETEASAKAAKEAYARDDRVSTHYLEITPQMKGEIPTEGQPLWGSQNKVYTPERLAKAEAIISKQLRESGRMAASGLPVDPVLAKALLEVAGFHIEAGARKFSDFSKKMVDQIGEHVKPYLEAAYNHVLKTKGFSGMEQDFKAVKPTVSSPDSEISTVESKPSTSTKTTEVKPIVAKGIISKAADEAFTPIGKNPTSIKNRIVEAERVERSESPFEKVARKEFGKSWDEAVKLDTDKPFEAQHLVDSLRDKPRPMTDTEVALLTHHRVKVRNEYYRAVKELNDATNDVDRLRAHTELARASDVLGDLDLISKHSGTESGRGLNARKMMVNDDFTLANLEQRKRAANGGRQLTTDERTELERIANDYKEKAEGLEKRLAEKEEANSTFIQKAEKFVARLDKRADAARERLKARGAVFTAGIDPLVLKDLADIGASHLGKLGLDFAKFSDAMIREFGDKIKPHLKDIFNSASILLKKTGWTDDHRLLAYKSRLEKQITDLETAISNQERLNKSTKTLELDDTAKELKEKRDELKKEYEDLFDIPTERYNSVRGKSLQKQIDSLSKQIDANTRTDYRKTGNKYQLTPETESLIAKRDALKKEFNEQFGVDAERRLNTYKSNTTRRIADLERRIQDQDFSKRKANPLQLDAEAQKLQVQLNKLKNDFADELYKDEQKNRAWWEKTLDGIAKWERFGVLTWPTTFAKLTSAAAQRMIVTPVEEGIGGVLSKVPYVRKVAEKAPRQGGLSLKAEAKAWTDAVMKGIPDAGKQLKMAKTDLETLYGKHHPQSKTILDFPGHTHGAFKAPVKRAEFARSLQKQTEWAIKNKLDLTDPMIRTDIELRAYTDADRAIFMQDNRVVNAYKRFVGGLETKDKATGRVTVPGKLGATGLKLLNPIVKIPTNYVGEVIQHATGEITGSVKLAKALKSGTEKLSPTEADNIMRYLKKGIIGVPILLLGYYNPQNVGGYYQPGEDRRDDEPQVGGLRLFGYNIPRIFVHTPLLELLQIGATIRRVSDSKWKKSDVDTKGMGEGLIESATGLGQEVPFLENSINLSKMFNARERTEYLGELTRTIAIPGIVQWTANSLDTNEKPRIKGFLPGAKAIKRKPESFLDVIKMGVPGYRSTIKAKPNQ